MVVSSSTPDKGEVPCSSHGWSILHFSRIDFERALRSGQVRGKYYSPVTASAYGRILEKAFERYQTWDERFVEKYVLSIRATYKESRVKAWKALRCYARYKKLPFPENFPQPEGNKNPKRACINENDVDALFDACKDHDERLLLSLYVDTGLRRSEAIGVRWSDVDLEGRRILVRHAKGGRHRYIGVPSRLYEILQATPKKKGLVLGFKATAVREKLAALSVRAGVKHVTPHMLRRAFVTINMRKNRPPSVLQKNCGHRNLTTTLLYNRLEEEEVIKEISTW